MGCLGKGCALVVFFAVALVGGGFWAVRHFRSTYSEPQPLTLAQVTSENLESYAAPEDIALPSEPEPAPTAMLASPPVLTGNVQARWDAFEKAADRKRAAQIELTAGDINTLINNASNLRGKGAVEIQNNIGRVTVSVPLDKVVMMGGRYLNGSCTVEASPDGDPAKVRISNIKIANQAVADSWLDQEMFGWRSVRSLISGWLEDQEIESFRIENNRVIGETRGSR